MVVRVVMVGVRVVRVAVGVSVRGSCRLAQVVVRVSRHGRGGHGAQLVGWVVV